MNLADRINKRMSDLGLTQEETANRANISQGMVYKLTSGKSKSTAKIIGLARALECSIEWLATGQGEMNSSQSQRDFANESALSQKSLGDSVPILGYVPLISWVQAGEWHEPIDNFQPGDGDDMLPCPVPHSEYTYCVQVSGESMIDEYPEGYIIFVDPKLEPKHKDDVIVRLLPENEVTFKRLMVEGNKKYLKALNKNWPNPIIPINGDAEFCGVVVFAGKYPRK